MSPSLRIATPDDAPAVAAVYAPYVLETAISLETEPPDADEVRRRMTRVLAQLPWLVVEDDGALIGYACATEHGTRRGYRFGVDVAVYVARGRTGAASAGSCTAPSSRCCGPRATSAPTPA